MDPSQRVQKFDAWSLDAMSRVIQPKVPIEYSLIKKDRLLLKQTCRPDLLSHSLTTPVVEIERPLADRELQVDPRLGNVIYKIDIRYSMLHLEIKNL